MTGKSYSPAKWKKLSRLKKLDFGETHVAKLYIQLNKDNDYTTKRPNHIKSFAANLHTKKPHPSMKSPSNQYFSLSTIFSKFLEIKKAVVRQPFLFPKSGGGDETPN